MRGERRYEVDGWGGGVRGECGGRVGWMVNNIQQCSYGSCVCLCNDLITDTPIEVTWPEVTWPEVIKERTGEVWVCCLVRKTCSSYPH